MVVAVFAGEKTYTLMPDDTLTVYVAKPQPAVTSSPVIYSVSTNGFGGQVSVPAPVVSVLRSELVELLKATDILADPHPIVPEGYNKMCEELQKDQLSREEFTRRLNKIFDDHREACRIRVEWARDVVKMWKTRLDITP